MKHYAAMFVAGLLGASIADASDASVTSSQELRPEFSVEGAHMGQDYWAMRRMFPGMECKASCTDGTLVYLKHPGTLWVSIGEGKINKLAFYFNVARADGVRRDLILRDLRRLYGKPTADEDCSVWARAGGAIRFCPQGTGAIVHWNNKDWQHISSVIPTVAPNAPHKPN